MEYTKLDPAGQCLYIRNMGIGYMPFRIAVVIDEWKEE